MIDINKLKENVGIKELTDMQKEAIEKHLTFSNIQLLAPTGSGKSIAFIFSALQKIKEYTDRNVEVVILVPSRELALQIERVVASCKTKMKIISLYGGHNFRDESSSLKNPPKIVIATPGRLSDHIRRGTIDLSQVHHVIIDEYDKCLEMGFDDDIFDIFAALPAVKSRTLTSATSCTDLPRCINFSDSYTVDFSTAITPIESKDIVTKLVEVKGDRLDTLYELLTMLDGAPTLVFCNYRETTERISDFLWDKDVVNDFYHGLLEQPVRERALIKLSNKSINILVATDLAARGLDIDSLKYVIHYEMAQSPELFIHRSGRTGRMNSEGENFVIMPKGSLPGFIPADAERIRVKDAGKVAYPLWESIYIGAGKKDKISKGDIVGFLTNKGGITPEDIGSITVRDRCSYVAIRAGLTEALLPLIRNQKIKKSKPTFYASR